MNVLSSIKQRIYYMEYLHTTVFYPQDRCIGRVCDLCLYPSVQVGVRRILHCHCQVKSLESPRCAPTVSTTTNLATLKMLMSLKTSSMATATFAMATAHVIVTVRATVPALTMAMHRCLSQRKGCGSVAGRDSELSLNSLLAADTSAEES